MLKFLITLLGKNCEQGKKRKIKQIEREGEGREGTDIERMREKGSELQHYARACSMQNKKVCNSAAFIFSGKLICIF